MQFILAAAALVAAATATDMSTRNSTCNAGKDHVKIVNRCSYPVYLWSIEKEMGCSEEMAFELETGGLYNENYRTGSAGGISIKISKTETCGGKDLTQLEYKIDNAFNGNFLDMSFVDCTSNLEDCPGRTDGFYLRAGNQTGTFASSVNNEHCPVFNVYNAEEAAKVSYVNWDDRQTKFCPLGANLELYLCGGDAPSDDDNYSAAPVSSAAPSSQIESSSAAPSSSPKPTSSAPVAPSSTEEAYVVAAAAVTEAPASSSPPVVKTEVVYVTQYVKRHAHGRRHQHFHA